MTRRPRPASRRTDRHLSAAPPPDPARADDTRPDAHPTCGRAVAPVVALDRVDTATLTPDQRAAAVNALAALIHTWHHDTHTSHGTRSRRRTSTARPNRRRRADQLGTGRPGTHHRTEAA